MTHAQDATEALGLAADLDAGATTQTSVKEATTGCAHSSATCTTAAECLRQGTALAGAATKSEDEHDLCTAVRSLEKACELAAHRGCERAAMLLVETESSTVTCDQHQVCFLAGASSCTPP